MRQEIIVLDRPNAVETTIRDYLRLSAGQRRDRRRDGDPAYRGPRRDRDAACRGLDTKLVGTGWPLTIVETMQLKLAAAIIARPRLLVLSQAYDAMPEVHLLRAMDALQERASTTIVYFTYENIDLAFRPLPAPRPRGADHGGQLRRLCEEMGLSSIRLRPPAAIYGEEDRRGSIQGEGAMMPYFEYHGDKFTTLNGIEPPRAVRVVGWACCSSIVIVALFLTFVPWVQTA
jgi:hypothetical protein